MKHLFLIVCCIILPLETLFANGGPVASSSVISTGEMRFLNMPNVELLKERLTFHVIDDYCKVDVEYTLKNLLTNAPDTIQYAFPIDFVRDEDSGKFNWKPDNIKSLHFLLDNKPLRYSQQIDFNLLVDTMKDAEGQPMVKRRKWYLTEFIIGQNATVTLKVSYRIKSNFLDWGTSKAFFVDYGQRKLYWDFAPAQYWGDGKVKDLNITVNVAKNIRKYGKIKISGLPFVKNDSVYSFSAKDYNLSDAKPLLLSYNFETLQQSAFIRKYTLPDSMILYVKSSSQKEGYPVENVKDKNYTTAWVSANEKSDWIEINTKPFNWGALLMVNGYAKSAESYYNNNRPKKIRIEYDIVDYKDPKKRETEKREMDIPDKPFNEVTKENLFATAFVKDMGDGNMTVTRVRITILDVYKGKKYNDTCISELLLLGYTAADGE